MSDEVHMPTLAREVKAHDIALFGRDGKNGLNSRVNTLESDVYQDPKTDMPGLVPWRQTVEKRMVWMDVKLWALIGLVILDSAGVNIAGLLKLLPGL